MLGRRTAATVEELHRRLRETVERRAACAAELDQVEAEKRDLHADAADYDLAEWQRANAEIERRIVEHRHELDHLTATESSLRDRGVEAVGTEIARREGKVNGERDRIEAERRGLLAQLARLDAVDGKIATRLTQISDERLPMLARFDPASAAALAAREKAERDEAVQLAHRRIRGEEVYVPGKLAAMVDEVEPSIRADLAHRQRDERASLLGRGVGYVKLDQFEQPIDGAPARRRGFADPDED